MPKSSFDIMYDCLKDGKTVPSLSKFEKEIIYSLRRMSVKEIAEFPDVSEGLEYSIKDAASSCNTIVELIEKVKSKRHTQTRIQRILVYILLGITNKEIEISKKIQPYIRVLAINSKGKELLSAITTANPKLEVITSVKKYLDDSNNKNLKNMLLKDILATDIYTIGYEYDSHAHLDYTHKLVTAEENSLVENNI